MKKFKWIVLLSIVLSISLFILLNKDFGENLYDLLAESHRFNLIEFNKLKALKDVPLSSFASSENQVTLKSDYTLKEQAPVYRDIVIQIPEHFQEKRLDCLYQFVSQDIKFGMNAQDIMNFNIVEANPKLLEAKLKENQVRYNPKWFEFIEDELLSQTNEALFKKSLSIKLNDIKGETSTQALYKAILYESLRCFVCVEQPLVIYEESSSLYFFLNFMDLNMYL